MNMVATDPKLEKPLAPHMAAIVGAEKNFREVANNLDYEVEKVFATQALMKTDFAMQIATKNPTSVKLAMMNLAATGLTLNPAYAYAYLVPRDGAIVLDISYKGLLRIATDTGSIMWGRADCVYEKDAFEYLGPAAMPIHKANPFADRGEVIGVYCIAKTCDGDILTDVLDMAEIAKIRGKSDLYAKRKSGPWVEWFTEMCCKAVIKRAQKTWPHSDRTDKLLNAIEMANKAEGGYTLEHVPLTVINEEQQIKVNEWLESTGVNAQEVLSLFDVETVAAIPKLRYNEVIDAIKAKGAQ